MSTAAHGSIPELTLGWRLRMALGEMKVQEMADTLGVNRATVGRWMHDEGARPKRAYLLQWAVVTGTDANWLEKGETPTGTDPSDGGQRQLDASSIPRYVTSHDIRFLAAAA